MLSSLVRRVIVGCRGPNTADLVAAGGGRKPVQVVLMADRWVDDPKERADCKMLMESEHILPQLPQASSHDLGDSCNPWPPTADDRRLAAS